jgi:EmrB/QacA subfamily drug resistance transporter
MTAPKTVDYRPLSLLVGMAFFMENLDSTIIAPAIPQIAVDFGIDPLSLNLTMTFYLLCNVVFIPISGFLAARWGSRSLFRLALLLFACSSLGCGLADDLVSLTLGRAVQGMSAALMVPVGRSVIVHTTRKADLVVALAWMITPAMLGPFLGGLIVTYVSWEWIFFINLPLGIVGYFAAERYVPQIKDPAASHFDPGQWLLLALALELLRHPGLDPVIYLGLALLGVGALGGYALRNRRYRPHERLLNFELLQVMTFRVSFWSGGLIRVGYGALPFLLPLFLQLGLGFSALHSGLVLLASGAVALMTKTCTALILRRFGFRRVLIWNGLCCALALALCALFRSEWGLALLATAVSLGGFFRSIQFNALTAIAYADLPRQQIAAATSLNTTFQQLAVMLGIALAVLSVDGSARFFQHAAAEVIDFALAFVLLAAFALASAPFALRLDANAGSELSGHQSVVR